MMLQLFWKNTVMELGISVGGALLFCMFIIYDTHQIMTRVNAEEYVLASIELYLDMLNLFVSILRILNAIKRSD